MLSWNPPSSKTRTYLSLIHSQYHGCWCPGDTRSQGISNNDIYYVDLDEFGPHVLRVNTLRLKQNGCHFPNIFKWIFLNENVWVSINMSLKFVPKGPVSNIPALVQIIAWCWLGDRPLSEPMMVSLMMRVYTSLGLNELTQWIVLRKHRQFILAFYDIPQHWAWQVIDIYFNRW